MSDIHYRNRRPSDFDALHELVSHWDVTRMLGSWPWPPDPAFTRKRCEPYVGNGFVWVICRNDRPLGTVSVTNGELGYMLHPNEKGKGIVSRAVNRALVEAFSDPARELVTAEIWADNEVSRHILQKFGFELTAKTLDHSIARRKAEAGESYALSRARWEKSQKR